MPVNTAAIVSQSARVVLSPRSQALNNAIHIGEVYWRRMALAAVVSLLAIVKAMAAPAMATAATICTGEKVKRNERPLIAIRKSPAIKPRPPAAASGGHSTNL